MVHTTTAITRLEPSLPQATDHVSYAPTALWYIGRAVMIVQDTASRIVKLFNETMRRVNNYLEEANEALMIALSDGFVEIRRLFVEIRRLFNVPVITTDYGAGIANSGNTCYIASVLQGLRFSKKFRANLNSPQLNEISLARKLKQMYTIIEEEKRIVSREEIHKFRKKAIKHGWQPKYENSQEDPSAFCQFLLGELGHKNFAFKTAVKYNFALPVRSLDTQGGFDNQIALPIGNEKGNHELSQVAFKNSIEEEVDKLALKQILTDPKALENIMLEGTDRGAIVQDVAGYALHPTASEVLEKMKDIEYIPTSQTVQMYEDKIPDLLPLFLRRYGYNKETKEQYKMLTEIHPSDTMDFPIANDSSGKKARFRHVSSILHDGNNTSNGHYRTFVPRHEDDKSTIVEFDDATARAHLDTSRIQGNIDQNGYLFFYEFVGIVEKT